MVPSASAEPLAPEMPMTTGQVILFANMRLLV